VLALPTRIGRGGGKSNGNPTAVDKCGWHTGFMQSLRHIVVGTDFSCCADGALEQALGLAALLMARVTVVHVCELGTDELEARRLQQCAETLGRLIARYQRQDVELRGVLRSGAPCQKLANVAVEVGAGLIVVGRHGVGRSMSSNVGFVAERLIRTANRSVLTVACEFNTCRLG
jgi:nucleotide-binding universal stress UspA family protein